MQLFNLYELIENAALIVFFFFTKKNLILKFIN